MFLGGCGASELAVSSPRPSIQGACTDWNSMAIEQTESAPRAATARSAVSELERELRSRSVSKWLRRGAAVLVLAAVGTGVWGYRKWTAPPQPAHFILGELVTRDLVETVQSTGKLKPLKEVQVGAQVSGRVVKVHADFNSVVAKGDLLAEIDPSLFGAQVSQVRGQITAAKAQIARAVAAKEASRVRLERLKLLVEGRVASQTEVETAQGDYDVAGAEVNAAQAQVASLEAQLNSASTTLGYTKIFAPISGVVISRQVDPGQTVAASFSAPVLFVIAQDLTEMEVLADIDEADVGKLKEGMDAEIVVDAFQGEVFQGKLTQLRFSPTDVQGVVTYGATVGVKNPELKLRPGMTVTVTVNTRKAPGVLAVPNAALRFRPKPKSEDGETSKAPGGTEKTVALQKLDQGQGRVYLRVGSGPEERAEEKLISIGFTDGVFTEVKGGLDISQKVITSERAEKKGRGFLGMF